MQVACKATPGSTGGDVSLDEVQPGVTFYAASLATGRSLLARVDDFVRQQSRFDRQARLNLRFETIEVTQAIYLDYVTSQVMAREPGEIDALQRIVSRLARRFSALDLGLPAKVCVVKTTHYQPTGNAVVLPDVPWGPPGCDWTLPQLKITNPDGADLDIYILMDVTEQPGREGPIVRRALMPLFQYLSWQVIALERVADGRWAPASEHGMPLLYDSGPLMEQYLGLVGRNIADEIFHPDEVLAQNFVLASKEPTPGLLATMQRLMAGPVRT